MDNFYVRWIGVPTAAIAMVGMILVAFLVNWLIGLVALLFIGVCLEALLTHAYAKKPALRDAHQTLEQ